MLPAAGWLPTIGNTNAPPEHWQLPVEYVGSYYNPAPVAVEYEINLEEVVLVLGDAAGDGKIGWMLTDEKTLQLTLRQFGVFGVVLFDSLFVPCIPDVCFPVPTTGVDADTDMVLDCETTPAESTFVSVAAGQATLDCVDATQPTFTEVAADNRILLDTTCIPTGTLQLGSDFYDGVEYYDGIVYYDGET